MERIFILNSIIFIQKKFMNNIFLIVQNEYPKTTYNRIGMILLICIFLAMGCCYYYIRVVRVQKIMRRKFMKGTKNDFINAVNEFERIFPNEGIKDSILYEEWKKKYGYIMEFMKFNHKRLGLDKEYVEIVSKYLKYVNM